MSQPPWALGWNQIGTQKELAAAVKAAEPLNPLRAKLVSDLSGLNGYPYCGHSALMGKKNRESQDTGYLLRNFGKTVSKGWKEYSESVQASVSEGRKPALTGGGLIRSLGGVERGKEAWIEPAGSYEGRREDTG